MLHWSFIVKNVTRFICGIGLLTSSHNLVVACKSSPFQLIGLDPGCVGSTLSDQNCKLCFRSFVEFFMKSMKNLFFHNKSAKLQAPMFLKENITELL